MKCFNAVTILLITISLLCSPASADEKQYGAVFMSGKKVGHIIYSREVADRKVTTSEETNMNIKRMGSEMNVKTRETCIETTDGKPLAFESIQEMGAMMSMAVKGKVAQDGTVELTTENMGNKQQSSLQWPEGAVMTEGLRLKVLEKGLKEGTELDAKIFSPQAVQAIDANIKIGAKKDVDLLGKIVSLREVTTTLNMSGASIVATSYVNDDFESQHDKVNAMGMQMEMIACSKEFALSNNEVFDIVSKTLVPSPKRIGNLSSVPSIQYELTPAEGMESLVVPSTDNQKAERLMDGTVKVTVTPLDMPTGTKFPYEGDDQHALDALKPTRYIQSNDPNIVSLARQAVGDTTDAAQAAGKIESFVANHITHRTLSVGYASAAEVAQSKQGDCTEFAVLTAALCRAVGIPAQVVMGYAYVEGLGGGNGCFGGHAWTRAYIGGKWVGLDASFKSAGRGGYDPGHIVQAVGNGNPEDYFGIVNSIGQFRISKITIQENN